jgi:hypothetical protein
MRRSNLLLYLIPLWLLGIPGRSFQRPPTVVSPPDSAVRIFRLNLIANVPQGWETKADRLDIAIKDQAEPQPGVISQLTETWRQQGSPAVVDRALAMLHRVTGIRLNVRGSANGIRCLAARSGENIALLCWREENGADGEQLTLLRMHGLNPSHGYRLERTIGEVPGLSAKGSQATLRTHPEPRNTNLDPVVTADLPGGKPDVEIPIVLTPRELTLIELKSRQLPGLELSVSAAKWSLFSGETLGLNVIVHNVSNRPLKANLQLSASEAGMFPDTKLRTNVGVLSPGKIRAFRYQLRAPVLDEDRQMFLGIQGGEDARASLALHIVRPLAAGLEKPLLDLEGGGGKAIARIELSNRTSSPLEVQIHQAGTRPDKSDKVLLPPDGTRIVQSLEVTPPSTESGCYPVDIKIEGADSVLSTLQVYIGVPLLCRYATLKPNIDGDLREWADAEPIGMGRAEFVHDKEWHGPNDLSAYAYTRWDEQFFYFACAETDDVFFAPYPAPELWRGDSVQFAISTDRANQTASLEYGAGDHEFGMALLNATQPVLYRFFGPAGREPGLMKRGVVAIRRIGTRTYYEAAIPWSELMVTSPKAGTTLGFSIVVNDNDGKGRGYLEWGVGLYKEKHPIQFPPLRLVR